MASPFLFWNIGIIAKQANNYLISLIMKIIIKSFIVITAFVCFSIYQLTQEDEKMGIVDQQQRNLNEANFNGDTIKSIRELKFPGKGNYQLFKIDPKGLDYFAFAKDSTGQLMSRYILEGDVLYSKDDYILVYRGSEIHKWYKLHPQWVSNEKQTHSMLIVIPIIMGGFALFIVLLRVYAQSGKNDKKPNTIELESESRYPFKTKSTIIFILIWNIPFIMNNNRDSADTFSSKYFQISLLILLCTSLLILTFPKFRNMVVKENATKSTINFTAILLLSISTIMLLVSFFRHHF